jgi:transposase-like protein
MLPGLEGECDRRVKWFAPFGSVDRHDDGVFHVYIGGVLIGSFDGAGERNVLLVQLAEEPRTRVVELAAAFGVSTEVVRRARRAYEAGGIEAVVTVGKPGAPSKVTPELRKRAYASFARGCTVTETAKILEKHLSYGTTWGLHRAWQAEQVTVAVVATPDAEAEQACLRVAEAADDVASRLDAVASETVTMELAKDAEWDSWPGESTLAKSAESILAESTASVAPAGKHEDGLSVDDTTLAVALELAKDSMTVEEAVGKGGRQVQHAGAWVALAMLHAMGVYRYAAQINANAIPAGALRVALDAVAIALVLGQRCVEGVRRLATPSASTLLRADGTASVSWVRDMLHRFADAGAAMFHLAVAQRLIREGVDDDGRIALYIDNHTRGYTGKHTLRKGWKMQERRAVSGTTDYYVHDAGGRPLLRVDVSSHDSLSKWLRPIAEMCRRALGKGTTVLLGFDRGGAFAEEMAALREHHFEFVTYERAPYRQLVSTAFDHALDLELDGERETIRWVEGAQKNLGKGRGRVRRISLQTDDGKTINLLAVSLLPAEVLIAFQLRRWRQENAFKHGVERWGLNHLDGRKVEATPADDVIPNPARRRLDVQMRFARAEEGRARNMLARVKKTDTARARYEQDLARAMATQADVEALRPSVPAHAPVRDTPLADKLVRHVGGYKTVIDTLRVALANIESELAVRLAPHLPRAVEAKKTLANLFAAPGHVRLAAGKLYVELAPAATAPERRAIDRLLRELDDLNLTLPGDPERRVLRFRAQ